MLKKEFKRKDVERLRNLVQGKTETSSEIQIGYNKKQIEVFMPLSCPNCNKLMKKRLDEPNYKIHKKCFDCVIEFEHKLRIRGEYKDYIKKLQANNSLDIVNETESYLLDAMNMSNSGFVSEDGVVEKWVGGINKKEFTKQVKEAAKIRRKHIEKELND